MNLLGAIERLSPRFSLCRFHRETFDAWSPAALIPEKWTSTPLRAVNNRQFADIAPLGKSRCGPGSLPSDGSRLAALEGQHLAQPSPSAEDRFLLLSRPFIASNLKVALGRTDAFAATTGTAARSQSNVEASACELWSSAGLSRS
jgi:hypothetical protein